MMKLRRTYGNMEEAMPTVERKKNLCMLCWVHQDLN